ncbi:hypothetical protein AB0L41_48745 [Amycolatopsis mediterranei]|uniref:hypothetical protein n=1 Tax=Amycolatopsis mediterranei TaxID=33910 RepID=UPI003413758D
MGLLPIAVPTVFIWILLRAHSFAGASDWSQLIPTDLKVDVLQVLIAVLLITLLAVAVQPFQLRIVRLLEGYWDGWWLTALLAPVFVEYQTRKKQGLAARINRLDARLGELEVSPPAGTLQEQKRRQREGARKSAAQRRAEDKLQRYPRRPDAGKPETPLLPTALGNALRAGETSAGERYGLTTLVSWPRLYPLLSDKLATVHASARDSLDAAASFCVSFFVVFVIAVAALVDEPKAYWIPAVALGLCCVSYIGSIAAAVTYTTYVRVAFDLHRFDLLKAMHQKLPHTLSEEYNQFAQLSEFFLKETTGVAADGLAARVLQNRQYVHTDEPAAPTTSPSLWEFLGRLGRR